MKQTVNFEQFCDSFSDTYKDNFSYEGKRALFDWLEEYEESTGEEMELDPIALCCEFSEYESLEDFQAQFGEKYQSIADIENEATIIRINGKSSDEGAFIVQDF